MRRQLFAAGVAVALMLGAASPAMAKANNGKAKGHIHKPAKTPPAPKGPKAPKPPKANNKSGVSGGGEFATGSFSAQARAKHQPKGHFNYTDGTLKLRCRGFLPFTAAPGGTTVEFTNCATITGAEPNEVRQAAENVTVTFVDNGQPSATAKDSATFTFRGATYGGDLTGGNIKIR